MLTLRRCAQRRTRRWRARTGRPRSRCRRSSRRASRSSAGPPPWRQLDGRCPRRQRTTDMRRTLHPQRRRPPPLICVLQRPSLPVVLPSGSDLYLWKVNLPCFGRQNVLCVSEHCVALWLAELSRNALVLSTTLVACGCREALKSRSDPAACAARLTHVHYSAIRTDARYHYVFVYLAIRSSPQVPHIRALRYERARAPATAARRSPCSSASANGLFDVVLLVDAYAEQLRNEASPKPQSQRLTLGLDD